MRKSVAKKRQALFVYRGLGFPVELRNVPMIFMRGDWTPDVDLNRVSRLVLEALAHKPARLTGDEIRFIRISASMTLQQFAERCSVSHPAVMKWEGAGSEATTMAWATEKDIRLELLRLADVKPAAFVDAYLELVKSPPEHPQVPAAIELSAGVRGTAIKARRRAA